MLEQLRQIQAKKVKKKLSKEKQKYCLARSFEIEEYITQQWSPFMMEKSDQVVSRGMNISNSHTNEINQFFNEIEEHTKVRILMIRFLFTIN